MPDRAVLEAIKREAKRRGAPYKHVKAAVATGLVESNLQNLNHGDADSKGWRQERASLYKNPTNIEASVKRFFDEAAQHDKPGISSGELAARVQRPAAQYRGRYAERGGEAAALLKGTRYDETVEVPGTDTGESPDPDARKRLLLGYLANRGKPGALLELAGAMKANAQVEGLAEPGSSDPPPIKKNPNDLLELFYRGEGGVNVKHGQVVGRDFVSGHEDHGHVASGPKQTKRLARLATEMGLTVTSTTGGKHAPNSYHYSGKAIDVAGPPEKMAAFARRVARLYRVR